MSDMPALDTHDLRKTLGQFATGVTIITALDPHSGAPIGRTANSFSSVSLDPPLVLWSISRSSAAAPAYTAAPHFAVNILSGDQIDLSSRFAKSGADKFAGVDWTPGIGGVPVLPEVSAVFECSLHATHEGGDHTIIVGKVERFSRSDRPGLVFAEGRYGLVADHPLLAEDRSAETAAGEPHPYDDFLIPLLFRAYETLFAKFSEHLEAAGTNGAQMRILAVLSIRPGIDFDRLMRSTYLGEQTADDALAVLLEGGLVTGDKAAGLTLTAAGGDRLSRLIAIAQAFETEQLGALGAVDLKRLKTALQILSTDMSAP